MAGTLTTLGGRSWRGSTEGPLTIHRTPEPFPWEPPQAEVEVDLVLDLSSPGMDASA